MKAVARNAWTLPTHWPKIGPIKRLAMKSCAASMPNARRCSKLIARSDVTWIGAGVALAVMFGAIFSHLTILGIDVMGDGGLLFGLAVAVAACSAVLLFLQRRRLPLIGAYL